jgi:tetratricopeptide (TPR) repeat protein
VMYGKQGRLDDSIREFLRVIDLDLDRKWDSAHYNLGVSYRMQGRFEEAIREFQIAIELNPNHAAAINAVEGLTRSKK